MRIGFGVTVLAAGLQTGEVDGIGAYTKELAAALLREPGVELLPLSFGVPFPEPNAPPLAAPLLLPPYAPLACLSACTPLSFPSAKARAREFDLFHAPDHYIPCWPRLPTVATLMDAIPLSHPEWARARGRRLKNWLWRRTARWARHIITISEHSRREIIAHFHLPPERVSVIPLGVDQRYFIPIKEPLRAEIRAKLELPPRFFLFVGTLQPRKNVARIVAAHQLLPRALRREIPLVVVGRAGWDCKELLAQLARGEEERVCRWLGHLPDLELRALLQSGTALVFPSLAEGFGLPVAEAFASGLPVITANSTALPEVAGKAALLVDPLEIEEIAAAMTRLILEPELAATLREKGLIRARSLSWTQCAAKTMSLYRQIAASHSGLI